MVDYRCGGTIANKMYPDTLNIPPSGPESSHSTRHHSCQHRAPTCSLNLTYRLSSPPSSYSL